MRGQLSLRTRLILAVGAVALVALVVADGSVYASLKSYLYGQADSTLQVSHVAVEQAATGPSGESNPGSGPQPPGQGPGSSYFCAVGRESAPGMFIEVRTIANAVVSGEACPAFIPGKVSYSPKLPAVITGFTLTAADPDEPVVYFTVPSTVAGGPPFRVRASKLRTGGILIVADPIGSISNTLEQLLVLELLVTGGALIVAVLLGLWLVRVGLRPLRDVVRTAEAISAGDLMHRVPNAKFADGGRPRGECPQRDAGADPGRLLRTAALGEPAASIRLRCLPRASHADCSSVRLRPAVQTGRRQKRG